MLFLCLDKIVFDVFSLFLVRQNCFLCFSVMLFAVLTVLIIVFISCVACGMMVKLFFTNVWLFGYELRQMNDVC